MDVFNKRKNYIDMLLNLMFYKTMCSLLYTLINDQKDCR